MYKIAKILQPPQRGAPLTPGPQVVTLPLDLTAPPLPNCSRHIQRAHSLSSEGANLPTCKQLCSYSAPLGTIRLKANKKEGAQSEETRKCMTVMSLWCNNSKRIHVTTHGTDHQTQLYKFACLGFFPKRCLMLSNTQIKFQYLVYLYGQSVLKREKRITKLNTQYYAAVQYHHLPNHKPHEQKHQHH